MVHAFTSAGILPSQYINMSSFAAIGTVGHAYINQGISILLLYFMPLYSLSHGYVTIVNGLAELSIQVAVDKVCGLPDYSNKGEVHYNENNDSLCNSGSSQMPAMTPQPMLFTQLYHAWLEGMLPYCFIMCTCLCTLCIAYIVYICTLHVCVHINYV